MLFGLAVIGKVPVVDGEGSFAFGDAYPGGAGLSATRGDEFFGFSFGAHEILLGFG